MNELSYQSVGVDYDILDAVKREALRLAASTSGFLGAHGATAAEASRGEPAFVFSLAGATFAVVLECLGTKSLLAEEFQARTGDVRFDAVAYDTVAAIVNDLACVGAAPLVVNAYFATASSDWYRDRRRASALLEGWLRACTDARATWGGGESPSLPGLLAGPGIELAGSAVGLVRASAPILGDELAPGDDIVLLTSSGLHANGASLARRILAGTARGLLEPLPDGRSVGEALLTPSRLYAGVVGALVDRGVPVTYLTHITGHGFRKVMRARTPATYRIERLPPVPPDLEFLVGTAGMDARSAYATFNMGAGFAVFCRQGHATTVVETAGAAGIPALHAGRVEEGPRAVVLEPVGVRFDDIDLRLR
jgi:phosphoribosylformylglycinamidine cyclo-ligase